MRCNALTKVGTQCTRISDNTFCYQHQGNYNFDNLLNKSSLRLNNVDIKYKIRSTPEASIIINQTQLSYIPSFEGTKTLILDNLEIKSLELIQSLTRLSANNTLISTIPNFDNLLFLSLNNTTNLTTIPSLFHLRNLLLNDSSILKLPNLPELISLQISRTQISEIPAPKLKNLDADQCPNLIEITNPDLISINIMKSKVIYLHHLSKVQFLNATNSEDLLTIPYSNLVNLQVSGCRKLSRIPNINTLNLLQAENCLSLIKIPKMVENKFLKGCPFLPNTVRFENHAIYNTWKLIKLQRFFRSYLRRKFVKIQFSYSDLDTVVANYMY